MREMMLVDSHCHLNYPQFSEDLPNVIARAKAAGVGVMQTISTKRTDFAVVKRLAETYPEIYCSIGIHPHEAEAHADITEAELLREASHPRVIGIGETGLDFYYEHSPRETQIALFQLHIRVARQLDLPVIVHSRAADEETIRVLEEEMREGGSFRFLIHCFSSSEYLADKSLELGGYISCAGIVTFKKSNVLREIIKAVPENRLLVETDAPYLAPEPHRGKVCEPSFTIYTNRLVSELKVSNEEKFAAQTTENFYRLFSKAQR